MAATSPSPSAGRGFPAVAKFVRVHAASAVKHAKLVKGVVPAPSVLCQVVTGLAVT